MEFTMRKTGLVSWLAVTLLGLLVLATIPGCIPTATDSFGEPIPDLDAIGGVFDETAVDLTENSTFEDHQDEIRLIDRVGFSTRIVNNSGTPATVSLYVSDTPGLTDPANEARVLFDKIPVPAGGRDISYDESVELLQNFEYLQTVVEDGLLIFYSTADGNFDLTFTQIVAIITFTVG
jgi:hypothetical protein